jgi:CHAT domain-containing protein
MALSPSELCALRHDVAQLIRCRQHKQQHILAVMQQRWTTSQLDAYIEYEKGAAFEKRLHRHLGQAKTLADIFWLIGQTTQDPGIQGLAQLAQGDTIHHEGHAAQAIDNYVAAGKLFEQAQQPVRRARARGGELHAATHANQLSHDYLATFAADLQTLLDAEEWYRLAIFKQYMCLAHYYLGDFSRSITFAEEAQRHLLKLVPEQTRHLQAISYSNQANALLLGPGEIDTAFALHQQACAIFHAEGSIGLEGTEYLNITIIESLQGNYQAALHSARKATELFLRARRPNHAVLLLIYRAKILLALNRMNEAYDEAQQAMTFITQQSAMVTEQTEAYMALAAIATRLGHQEKALEWLTAGQQIAHTARQQSIPLQIERAKVLIALHQPAIALHEIDMVLRDPQIEGTELYRGNAQLVAAEAEAHLHHWEQAHARATAAVQVGERVGALDLMYYGHRMIAQVMSSQGQMVDALAAYDQAIHTLYAISDQLVLDQRPEFLQDKDDLFWEAMQIAQRLHDEERALLYLEQSRVFARWSSRDAGSASDVAHIEPLMRKRAMIHERYHFLAKEDPERAILERLMERIERELRDAREATLSISRPLPRITAADLRPQGLNQPTLLAYAVMREHLLIYVRNAHGLHVKTIQHGAAQLWEHITALTTNIKTVTHNPSRAIYWEDQMRRIMQRLWSVLIAPVEEEHWLPADNEPLLIVPHGILHTVPLAALHDGQRYLIERWPVCFMPACVITAAELEANTNDLQPPLAIGVTSNGQIPNAANEARYVKALFLGGEASIEEQAICSDILKVGQRRQILHFAAHGAPHPDHPDLEPPSLLASYLVLYDRNLYQNDIAAMDLRGCQLVVLSACQSGLGRRSGGDERLGLPRAFFQAGAEAVLATLWKVDDAMTFTFMDHFYRRVAAKMPPSQALRATQCAWLQANDKQHQHPYYWAGFALESRIYN